MHGLFRQSLAVAASVGLVFCTSCERHHADEMAEHGEHVKSGAAEKEGPHDKAKANEHRTMGDQQQMSTTALTPTPAQFFPSPTPH